VTATYDIELTAAHYATALLRFRRQQPDYWLRQLLPWAALLPASAAAVFAALTESAWEAEAITLAITGFLAAAGITYYQRRRLNTHLQRTPTFGERIQIILDEHGARSIVRGVASSVSWRSFTRATRFVDGFVLSQGGLDSWLPDAALTGASVADVQRLMQSKIAAFRAL
jgi:hypothetical protein